MTKDRFGKLELIRASNGGRFPCCNALLIDDDVKAVIDPGCGQETLSKLNRRTRVDLVLNTHFHFDHIAFNHLFEGARILINDIESDCFSDRRRLLLRNGIAEYFGEDYIPGWLDRISRPDSPQSPYSPQNRPEWHLSTARLDGTYRWGDRMDFGTVRMEIVGAPGHSEGFCCPYFPDEGIVYTGDIDLTDFGPWFFGSEGDIDQFIASARKIAALDADVFITAHEKGIFCRRDFRAGVDKFLGTIERRDRKILSALSEPRTLEELGALGLIYGEKFMADDWVRAWNFMGTKKHLERLVRKGAVRRSAGRYSLP